MSLLAEVAGEIGRMFAADARLTLAILALVGLVALLSLWAGRPGAAGAVLVAGALAILILSVRRAARR